MQNRPKLAYAMAVASVLFHTSFAAHEDVIAVSIVSLIDRPSDFVDQTVYVKGYLAEHAGFELFLSSDHESIRDYSSSVAVAESVEISLRDSNCLDRYVSVTGKLVKEEPASYILIAREVADATTSENCL